MSSIRTKPTATPSSRSAARTASARSQIDYRAAYSRATYLENYYYEAHFYGTDTYTGSYNNTADPLHFQYRLFNDAAETIPFVSTDATQYGNPPFVARATARSRQPGAEQFLRNRCRRGIQRRVQRPLRRASVRIRRPVQGRRQPPPARQGGQRLRRLRRRHVPGQPLGLRAERRRGVRLLHRLFPQGALRQHRRHRRLCLRAHDPQPLDRPRLQGPGKRLRRLPDVHDRHRQSGRAGGRSGRGDRRHLWQLSDDHRPGGQRHDAFVNNSNSYINAFPTVQLKYRFTPSLQVRATYSTGIARPGFTQAGGAGGVDFTTSPRPQATIGNPKLQPTTGNNFDFDVEYYMPGGGIIQAGVFDKEFTNYIFRSGRVNVIDPIFNGEAGDIFTFVNEDAYARGVELAYHQKFTFLPGLLSGLRRGREHHLGRLALQGIQRAGERPGRGRVQPPARHLARHLERGRLLRGPRRCGAALGRICRGQPVQPQRRPHHRHHPGSPPDPGFRLQLPVHQERAGLFLGEEPAQHAARYNDGIDRSRVQQLEYYGQTYEFGIRAHF